MYWGNSLLWGLSDIGDFLKSSFANVVYSLRSLLASFCYMIWRLLAWVVTQVESIFRNLAGIGGSNKDMVSEIINNKNVGYIFANLVGLATALIVFFTIVKIIQEHYKEKDGGNPYKIVIRTFKGLLMFFFVQAAVTVGLYASQIMFKALDAATGNGDSSIAGQVFRAMASEANRLRLGRQGDNDLLSDAMNQYYTRITNDQSTPKDGRYVLVEVSDEGKAKTAAELKQKYLDAFPTMRYGIVSNDGKSVTPLTSYLRTQDVGEDLKDNWNNSFNVVTGDSWNDYNNDGKGDMSVAAGYKHDILQGISTTIQPSISLTWSPIDIMNYGYKMEEADKIQHDVQILALGSGTLIPMSTTFTRYGQPTVTQKSMEDSAKVFGITLNAGVALQGGEASARFDIDMFDTSQFHQILQTILMNVLYTNLAKIIIQMVPQVPASTSIYAVNIRYMSVLAPFVFKFIKSVANETMSYLIPVNEDGKPVVEAFVTASESSGSSAGAWINVNDKSPYLPLVIEQYKIDPNFSDLWSQLTDAYADLLRQMESAKEDTWKEADGNAELLNMMSGKIQNQNDWKTYYGAINSYNDYASGLLTKLGNWLYLYDKVIAEALSTDEDRTAKLNDWGYTGSYKGLEEAIESTYTNLVKKYNNTVSPVYTNARPSSTYADALVVQPIYKPIIEFMTTDKRAAEMSAADIRRSMLNLDTSNGKVTVNMIIDDRGSLGTSRAAYRMLDWSCYGAGTYQATLGKYTDFYLADKDALSTEEQGKIIYSKSSMQDLAFIPIEQAIDEGNRYTTQGLNYFINKSTDNNNPFRAMATSGSVGGKYQFSSNGYWATDGVHLDGNYYYAEYNGTSLVLSNNNHGFSNASTSSVSTSSVDNSTTTRSSSAATSNLFTTADAEINETMADLYQVDTTTPLATDFAKNIVTFRRLDATDETTEKDKKALKEWISTQNSASVDGNATIKALYALDANQDPAKMIDDYMISTAANNKRRYLLLTQDGETDPQKLGSYVGTFSFNNFKTVNALYDPWSMNFAVGFIAIIAATGVYLNFAFGLIQRAVNMAVLYIMSPISISFYPFDDGQKFSQNFVTPFYKEAISAYAIIISLNLFIVLLAPVQDAVEVATGSSALGWLGLIAFVSMLPKIRDSICSLLGANPIAEKSLTDTFKGAKDALGKPFNDIKAGAKSLASGGAKLRHGLDRMKAHKQARNQKELSHLQELQTQGKLGWWGERRLNKLNGGAASQNRIDEARKNNKDLAGLSAKEIQAKTGLTASEARRLKRQDKAAEIRAKGLTKPKAGERPEDYQKRVAEQKEALLNDAAFKKSVNGVVAATRVGQFTKRTARAVKGGVGVAAHGTKKLVSGVGSFVANSGIGLAARSIGSGIKNSLVGEMFQAKFGPNGTKIQDKNSLVGEIMRWRNPTVRAKAQKEIAIKDRAYAQETKPHREAMLAGLSMDSAKSSEGDAIIAARAKQALARETVANSQLSAREKLQDLYIAENIKQGQSSEEARRNAEKSVGRLRTGEAIEQYKKMGGDEAYAVGLSKGFKEFKSAGIQIDFDSADSKKKLVDFEKQLRAKAKGGAQEISVKLNAELNSQHGFIQQLAGDVARGMGIGNDKEAVKNISKILEKTDEKTSFNDVVSDISRKLGVQNDGVERALNANGYQDFVSKKMQSNNDIADLRAVLDAQECYDKGEEMFRSKIGNAVSAADKNEILTVFKNVNDANLSSTNPESLGYKQNQIIMKYEDGYEDPACKAEVEELKKQMDAELDNRLQKFDAKYAGAIREHDIAQKYKQEMGAVDTMAMMTEYQHQREFHISTNMDVPSVQTIFNDSLIQSMHEKGNYAGAGLKMQQLIDAIKQHDVPAAKQLGFDDSTVEKLAQWEAQGLDKRLEGIRGLGVLDAAHMGSTLVDMGGGSMVGMQTGLARLTSIAEQKIIIDKFNDAANAFANQEGNARNMVKQVANSIENIFSGSEWNALHGQIKDMNGRIVTNQSEFASALKATLESVNNGTKNIDDPIIQSNLSALREFRAKPENQNNMTIVNGTSRFLDYGIAQATTANDSQDLVNAIRNDISSLDAKIRENLAKLKGMQGEK